MVTFHHSEECPGYSGPAHLRHWRWHNESSGDMLRDQHYLRLLQEGNTGDHQIFLAIDRCHGCLQLHAIPRFVMLWDLWWRGNGGQWRNLQVLQENAGLPKDLMLQGRPALCRDV